MTVFNSFKNEIISEENTITARRCSFDENVNDGDRETRIKFTRKFTHQYRSCCCILLSLTVTLLSACVVLFCGYHYVKLEPGEEITYHGSFTVSYNDTQPNAALYPNHNIEIATYIERLEKAVQFQPIIRLSLVTADILAIDRLEDETKSTILFELKFNPRLLFGYELNNLAEILKRNLKVPHGFVDRTKISLHEIYSPSMMSASSSLTPNMPSYSHIIDDNFSNTPGKCVSATQLPFCPPVYNNLTLYPNIFMHKNADDVMEDLVTFRELIDGECFSHAAEFLCQVLQPNCVHKQHSSIDEIFLPCHELCKEFLDGCGDRFSNKIKQSLDCSKFPEYSAYGKSCLKEPNCNIAALKSSDPFSYRLCDGVIDCLNLEDELSCDYCSHNDIHCGLNKNCITRTAYCNSVADCPNGSDEKSCLSLWPNTTSTIQLKTTYDFLHHKEGYVVYTQEGTSAILCLDKENMKETYLKTVAQTICRNTSYQDVHHVQVRPINIDIHLDRGVYSQLHEDPLSKMQFSVTNNCASGQTLYVSCSDAECGVQTTRLDTASLNGLNKTATAGDWPWHVALFKNGIHSCDATLLSESWLITSISCFQGQSKAEWVAKLGAVRLYGKSPWQQSRHIVGMLKSPVEGSTLVLIKLSSPVIFSNFVRPVCLPFNSPATEDLIYCNALGWDKSKNMLRRIEISESVMDNCEDMSIMIYNGLCAVSAYDVDECGEEEMAGSPMVCLTSRQQKWVLIGVSNWKISCSPIDMQRPRLYDKVVSNVNWIQNILKQL